MISIHELPIATNLDDMGGLILPVVHIKSGPAQGTFKISVEEIINNIIKEVDSRREVDIEYSQAGLTIKSRGI